LLLEDTLEGATRGTWGIIWGGRPRLDGAVLSKCCEFSAILLRGGLEDPDGNPIFFIKRSSSELNFGAVVVQLHQEDI